MRSLILALPALAALALPAAPAYSAEGMWTLDNLPAAMLQRDFGFSPDAAWVRHVMQASVRLESGCSASFVSPDGLVLTNSHCVRRCVSDLSTARRDLALTAFVADSRDDERTCPGLEASRLVETREVTATVRAALDGTRGNAFAAARSRIQAELEAACVAGDADSVRCQLVELYQGGQYWIYRYERLRELRLVFAPEEAAGSFGGDLDNFEFPRFSFDAALLRVWKDGAPYRTGDWFALHPAGIAEDALVVATGQPGRTRRLLTVSQLETLRDVELTAAALRLAELRGLLTRYRAEGAEQSRLAGADLRRAENQLKVLRGEIEALHDPDLFARKRADERALRDFVAADPALAARSAGAWEAIAQAQAARRRLGAEYTQLETGHAFASPMFLHARSLVRAAAERARPDGERLREYSESALPALRQRTVAAIPFHPDYEAMTLAWSLGHAREVLGSGHPAIRRLLGKDSPHAVAQRVMRATGLGDAAERARLWDGGTEAISSNRDPLLALAAAIDPAARAARSAWESQVESVELAQHALISAARFARDGDNAYPDASFTLRAAFGVRRGYEENGREVASLTTLGQMYERATGAAPFALPARWLNRRGTVDPSTPLNQVTTIDTIGGNSGSPIIDRQRRLVGLNFDRNRHALGRAYGFDETRGRNISVHPAAILAALEHIYMAPALVRELRAAKKAAAGQEP